MDIKTLSFFRLGKYFPEIKKKSDCDWNGLKLKKKENFCDDIFFSFLRK
jgi:hypothetical protein